jgi:GNAT superfamily N-acetyltransferase
MAITIKNLTTKEEMLNAFPLVNQMYQEMSEQEFSSSLDEMIELSNYKMVAAFEGDKMVAVSGYWIASMLYCGLYLQVSNLVVDAEIRGGGVGQQVLHYLETKAKDENCKKIVLDSYTENKQPHSLFFKENFYIRGFHFMKDL